MTYSIGVTQWFFPGLTDSTLDQAKTAGFDAVQLELGGWEDLFPLSSEENRQRYLEASRENGLALLPLTINDLCRHPFVNGLETHDGVIAIRALETGIEAAAKMHLEGITVPNFGDNRILEASHYHNTVLALRHACQYAKPMGLTVYTENVLSVDEMSQLFTDCSCDNLLLLFDSQNYQHFGLPYAMDVLRRHYDRTGTHVHVKCGTSECSAPLGEGEGPFHEVMHFLREMNYTGTIVTENNYNDAPLFSRNYDWMKRDIAVIRAAMDKKQRN
ncbi:MAG: sugar phosphate isomerase/epimerase [Blautia sp.]|nr:sugar phosphate isomerase/epimerase [Blautia sp.]